MFTSSTPGSELFKGRGTAGLVKDLITSKKASATCSTFRNFPRMP